MFGFFLFFSCPLSGPQMPPCNQCVSNKNRLVSNCTSKSLSLSKVDFAAQRFAHSSENLQEHFLHFLHLQREGSKWEGEETGKAEVPGTGRRCPPRAAHQRAQAPTPSRRSRTRGQVLKVTVGPNGVPLRPELLPALHQPPPSSQPVPTPWSRPLACRSPCSRAARGATYSNPPSQRAHPPSHLELSSNTRAKLRSDFGSGVD